MPFMNWWLRSDMPFSDSPTLQRASAVAPAAACVSSSPTIS